VIKVGIVEDQELIRSSLQIVLNMEEDIDVLLLAENGKVAIQELEQTEVDVILMDIHMPIMNGIDATKEIKKKWPHIKVLILTTFQQMDYVIDALNSGAEGYLLKAIDTKELIAGIKMIHKGGSLLPQDLAKQLFTQFLKSDSLPKIENKVDYGLSSRELDVLECLSNGLSNRDIAEKLFLSEGTVKNYISTIYAKLDVPNRMTALKKIRDEGLL
jgi:DNA-binding NarL/FixJ family response regulator